MGGEGRKMFILLSLLIISVKLINAQNSYVAAVLEHAPTIEDTPEKTILGNLDIYRTYTQQAHKQNADIIVFPEYALTSMVDDPEEYAIEIPTNNSVASNKILQEFHDMAIEHNIYIVVNLLEKVKPANEIKLIYYNTNLVFDRQGNIIAKYHKQNLYEEYKVTPGTEIVTFTTDFGVTFGIFTCFDIMFQKPSQDILLNTGVTDIIFPTAWFSKTPFYTVFSIQSGYSTANGVNLLAADYARPSYGNGGSGIYLANGNVAEAYIDGSRSSKLIVQRVEKISAPIDKRSCAATIPSIKGRSIFTSTSLDKFETPHELEVDKFVFKKLDLSQNQHVEEVCQENFCCTFNISISTANTNEIYKLVAFDGFVEVADADRHFRVCSLVACQNEDNNSCGKRINASTVFSKITVKGNLPHFNESFYRPTTFTPNFLPIVDTVFCANPSSDGLDLAVEFSTTLPQSQVLAFGILGRTSGVSLPQFNVGLLLAILMWKIFM